MAKYISLGKFNKNHLYIVYSIFFLILKDVITGYNYNNSFLEVFSQGSQENFSQHIIIHDIFCYLYTFIMSLFLYRKEIKYFGENSLIEDNNKENKPTKHNKHNSVYKIKYIHLDHNKVINNVKYSKNSIYFFIFFIFLWIAEEQLIEIYSILKDLDFWMIELIIISYLNSKMFGLEIFQHQLLVIYYNLIPIILKIIAISLSFKDENNLDYEQNGYTYKTEGRLKNLYVIYIWLIPVGVIIYLCLITLRSYVNCKIKWFMDLKSISSKKLLMIYGIMGTIICSIVCVITTFKECEEVEVNSKPDIYNYICIVNLTSNNKTKKYFDSFYVYFKNLKDFKSIIIELIKIIFEINCFYFNKYYSILIIKYLTPVHLIISFPVYYLCQKITLFTNTLIRKGEFFYSDKKINYIEAKFSLDISGDILSIIGFLIYLEIIELNFCNLDFNLRKSIINRANSEINILLENDKNYLLKEDEDLDEQKIEESTN